MPAEKTLTIGDVPTLVSPNATTILAPPKSKMAYYFVGCLGLGAILLTAAGIVGYLYWPAKNPLARFTNQYTCTIDGEPEPTTSDEYFLRAKKHIGAVNPESATVPIDDCAVSALNEALRLDPKNVQALRVRGYSYNVKKQYDLALADYDKAIQIEPNNPDNYIGRRYSYELKGLIDKAIEDQTTLINLLSQNNPANNEKLSKEYKKRADLYAKKGEFENASKDLKEASRLIVKAGDDLIAAKEKDKTNPESSNNNSNPNSAGTISGGVLNDKATNLVKPTFPPVAKAVRASGSVSVQVTVDEKGDVISASAVSGHPLLRASAVQAARALKFSPTVVSGKPVKVTGIVIYNFVP